MAQCCEGHGSVSSPCCGLPKVHASPRKHGFPVENHPFQGPAAPRRAPDRHGRLLSLAGHMPEAADGVSAVISRTSRSPLSALVDLGTKITGAGLHSRTLGRQDRSHHYCSPPTAILCSLLTLCVEYPEQCGKWRGSRPIGIRWTPDGCPWVPALTGREYRQEKAPVGPQPPIPAPRRTSGGTRASA
jgi:hypothetical protein